VHVHEKMSADAKSLLYVGLIKFTQLSTILRLMNLKGPMSERIKVSQNCWCSWMKCFSMEIFYPLEIMMLGTFFVLWVLSIKGGMHILMIAYYTGNNLKIWKKCSNCGLSWYRQKTNNKDNDQIKNEGLIWK